MNANLSSVLNDTTKRSLREAIFWEIAHWTAHHRDLGEIFPSMKEVADAAVSASTAELFCNDRLVKTIRFGDDDDPFRQVSSLHYLQHVLYNRGCWFEDSCPEGVASFCWSCGRDYYQLIFK